MSLLTDLLNLNLPDCTNKVNAEHICIGGTGTEIRSKARMLSSPLSNPSKLLKWNYEGSTTSHASGEDSHVIVYPKAIFKDPFKRGDNIIVKCDCYTPTGEPFPTNKRYNAAKIFSHPDFAAEEPCYGIELEYTLLQKDVKRPTGWPIGDYPVPQGPYCCAAGADKAFGCDIVSAHCEACLYARISKSGIKGEIMPGHRITEIAGVVPSFDPKPSQGDWNGARARANHRTSDTARSVRRRKQMAGLMLLVLMIANLLPLSATRMSDGKRLSNEGPVFQSLPKGPTRQLFKEGLMFDSRTPTPSSCRSGGTSDPNMHNACTHGPP